MTDAETRQLQILGYSFPLVTHTQAKQYGAPRHSCDEAANVCNDLSGPKSHRPGDRRCSGVALHAACSHDLRWLAASASAADASAEKTGKQVADELFGPRVAG